MIDKEFHHYAIEKNHIGCSITKNDMNKQRFYCNDCRYIFLGDCTKKALFNIIKNDFDENKKEGNGNDTFVMNSYFKDIFSRRFSGRDE